MKYFTIDSQNDITVHASRKEARETNAAVFSTEEQLADVIGNDNQRLIDIFNGLPGVTPVKKFTNRKIATERIWKAIQSLGGSVAPESVPTPEAAAAKSDASPTETPVVEPITATSEAEPAVVEPVAQPP
jgi:hypothetical protein